MIKIVHIIICLWLFFILDQKNSILDDFQDQHNSVNIMKIGKFWVVTWPTKFIYPWLVFYDKILWLNKFKLCTIIINKKKWHKKQKQPCIHLFVRMFQIWNIGLSGVPNLPILKKINIFHTFFTLRRIICKTTR